MRFKYLTAIFVASLCLTFGLLISSCGSDEPDAPETLPPDKGNNDNSSTDVTYDFIRGADVSWLSELEDKGNEFYNQQGNPTELMQLLKTECGVNAIRLRVWVNPANKYNSIEDVLAKAERAYRLGLKLMIDFHLSDTWADPGHQTPPAAWKNFNESQMSEAIDSHVTSMLTALKMKGITPEWVQIGNETRGGMLLPMGQMTGNSVNSFVRFLNSGYKATKDIFPDCKVMVHLDNGYDGGLYQWFFQLLKNNGGKYDMIGMSLYPEVEQGSGASWTVSTDNAKVSQCISNIKDLYHRFGKRIMLCEIGFHWSNHEGCASTLQRFIDEFSKADILEGIFYWEPESEPANTGYHKGCFKDGKPTPALAPFAVHANK